MIAFKKLSEHSKRNFELEGINYKAHRTVFSGNPKYTHSTSFLINSLNDLHNKTVLDMGSGSGILSLYSVFAGAKYVLAVDSYKKAVTNTNYNVNFNNLSGVISCKKSNLFEKVNKEYDVILANLLCHNSFKHKKTVKTINKFIDQCSDYVKPGARVYFTWASFIPLDQISENILSKDYACEFFEEERLGVNWNVFKLSFK